MRYACSTSASAAAELFHVLLRNDDACNEAGQRFMSLGHLGVIKVPVVNAAHAGQRMAKTALGVIARHTARAISDRAVRRRS